MIKNKVIMGIDPGIASVGYGVIKQTGREISMIDYGCIRTHAGDDHIVRLKDIYRELKKIIQKNKPDIIAVEELFFAKNVKTALKVGEARGVILYTIIEQNIPFCEFTPLQVKQSICGYGRATKEQIQKMVKILLNLEKIPRPDDAADALAIGMTCLQVEGFRERIK